MQSLRDSTSQPAAAARWRHPPGERVYQSVRHAIHASQSQERPTGTALRSTGQLAKYRILRACLHEIPCADWCPGPLVSGRRPFSAVPPNACRLCSQCMGRSSYIAAVVLLRCSPLLPAPGALLPGDPWPRSSARAAIGSAVLADQGPEPRCWPGLPESPAAAGLRHGCARCRSSPCSAGAGRDPARPGGEPAG